jgi:hypothetical protein
MILGDDALVRSQSEHYKLLKSRQRVVILVCIIKYAVKAQEQRSNSIKAFAPSFNTLYYPPHRPFKSVLHHLQQSHLSLPHAQPFKELGLDSQRLKKRASKLHVHFVNYAAKLVHTRRALFNTIISSHEETISGPACNPPDPHQSISSSFGGGNLRYSVP